MPMIEEELTSEKTYVQIVRAYFFTPSTHSVLWVAAATLLGNFCFGDLPNQSFRAPFQILAFMSLALFCATILSFVSVTAFALSSFAKPTVEFLDVSKTRSHIQYVSICMIGCTVPALIGITNCVQFFIFENLHYRLQSHASAACLCGMSVWVMFGMMDLAYNVHHFVMMILGLRAIEENWSHETR